MRRLAAALSLLLALTFAPAAGAQTIKLGTMAPDGSGWHNLLKQMGEKWAEASGGKVKLKIFPGGVAGNESDMVRKLQVGQMQAATLSVVGLHDIEASVQAMATPGLITTEEEWAYVFPKIQPVLEKRLLAKGYVTLFWGDAGWVHMFYNKPLTVPQMKGVKVFTWAGDPAATEAWKAAGFQPVVLSATDILTSLSTGMIDGFGSSPIMAFTARWYEYAKYMTPATWGHLPGATIISKKVWDTIPPEVQTKIMAASRETGTRINTEVGKMQTDAVEQMKKSGLKVLTFSDADREAWNKMAEATWPKVKGATFPAEAFDEVKKLRDEYRATQVKK